jgi:putative heme-binding domain-containing protein
LWQLGPPSALSTFNSIALDRQRKPEARQIAIEALGGLNDVKAGEALVKLIATEHDDPAADAARLAMSLLARKIPGPWRGLAKRQDLLAAVERQFKNPELSAAAIALSRVLGTRPLSQWMLSQPLSLAGKSASYPPEKMEKPEQASDWTRARPSPDGSIDIAGQRTATGKALAYAATLIHAKEEFSTRLWVGSSAGIAVWLNGKLVHSGEPSGVSRRVNPDHTLTPRQHAVAVTLGKGVNRLLIKVEAGAKNWGYVVELEDPLGRAAEITDQSLPKISAPASERLDPKKLPPDRELLTLKGDADRGRQVFLRSKAGCASCHKIKDEGGTAGVGPALDGLGVKMSREAILAEILRPSQSIRDQYVAWTIETKDGKLVNGVIVENKADRLVLKDVKGNTTSIRKQDIEQRLRSEVSVMPELLAGELTRQELADLLEYLAELK